MSVGYEGLVLFNNTRPVLCTGASVPYRRVLIESNSGYSGIILPTDPTRGIAHPRTYGYPENQGSFSFDADKDFLSDLIDWIFNRKTERRLDIKPANSSLQRFDECFWTNITLSATEGSMVNGSVDFIAIERTAEIINTNYISNKEGVQDLYWSQMFPLNPSVINEYPIPFWKTKLGISSPNLISWNLNLQQEIKFYFGCEGSPEPEKPSYIGIGTMTGSLQVEYYIDGTFIVEEDITELDLTLGNYNTLKLRELELQERNSDVKGQNDLVNIDLNYSIYGMEA